VAAVVKAEAAVVSVIFQANAGKTADPAALAYAVKAATDADASK
jgi:hypothetical protein